MVDARRTAQRPVRRRGRPAVLPDEEFARSPRERYNARIGWLLATNRLLGPRPDLADRAPFLAALEARGLTVDASTASRWESGSVGVTDSTAALYEQVLGLPDGSLVAVISGLRRAMGEGDVSSRPREPIDRRSEADLERQCELAASGKATGGDWLSLTRRLTSFDLVRLPRDEWTLLSRQLITELGTSVGLGFVRRYEAAVDLLARRESSGHLASAIDEFVSAPDAQLVGHVVSLLTEDDDAAAGALATRLLDSDNPVVRLTAAWAASVKLARGHRAGLNVSRMESYVTEGLGYGDSLSDRLESANLAVHLPHESWARVTYAVDADREVAMVDRARRSGELYADDPAMSIVEDLADAVAAATPPHVPVNQGSMLRTLVREALVHAHSGRRLHATRLLAASPYAPAIARQCRSLAHTSHPVLAARVNEVLMVVTDPDDGEHSVRDALAETREAIRAKALIAIGLRRAGLAESEGAAIAEHVVRADTPLDRASGLVALGMSGSSTVVELRRHERLAPAAQWWIDIGPARLDPDDRHRAYAAG